ncbi:Arc family DNA-binding protein [Tepidiforma sp.]|uniref:FitA-like ribbon-helix-helix domain-containing protein n=1 Tax=Tepidiforma sp. TaxID=2682230 RepID=UPI002607DED5|nr:Arc family DNA-binding protein [Tepidiforma sp.]MCX7618935.1 Arc family DNA-binding protein [Tepidiforma sp.]
MATLTIRNVPDELYAALKERARRNRRSLNQEVLALLEGECGQPGERRPTRDDLLAEVDALRAKWAGRRLTTAEELETWRREGRA